MISPSSPRSIAACFTTSDPTPRTPRPPNAPAAVQQQDTQVPALLPAQAGVVVPPADPVLWTPTTGHLQLPDDLAVLLVSCLGTLTAADSDAPATPHGRDRAYHRLVELLTRWAHTTKRRLMLRSLGWAATAAALGHTVNPDEQARVAAVLTNPARLDAATIEHIETVLWHCRRQDAALGPHAVLDTVLAQRQLAASLLPNCPASLRPRLLSALSDASRQAGWLSFDLTDFDSAGYYYEDARARAHQAQNGELCAFVLCEMSHSATWQNKPRIGLDHAAAAQQWAGRTGDMRLRAYTADVAARACAADGQRKACLTALNTAHAALPAPGDQTPSYVHFYDEPTHLAIRGLCHLGLQDGQRAADYTQQSLGNLDPSHSRNTAFATMHLGMAYIQCRQIDEAARLLGAAGEIAAHNSSARLIGRLRQARTDLQPWKDSAAVRTLDDRLSSHGLVFV